MSKFMPGDRARYVGHGLSIYGTVDRYNTAGDVVLRQDNGNFLTAAENSFEPVPEMPFSPNADVVIQCEMPTQKNKFKKGDRVSFAGLHGPEYGTVVGVTPPGIIVMRTFTGGTVTASESSFELAQPGQPDGLTSGGSALDVQEGGSHYKDMRIQPIEFIHANNIPFAEGSIIKYVARWRSKNGIQDLKKARHFLDLLIELEEKNHA